jgi:4-diphosphocytidyl-2-C-methyl-D-erythritol kinase
LKLDLDAYNMVIVKPRISVRTADAYSEVVPARQPSPAQRHRKAGLQTNGNGFLGNDFELPVLKKHPSIGRIKEKLYQMGAVYASMSGSGSAVFALFDRDADFRPDFRGSLVWQSQRKKMNAL